ncbi:hypothetical protein N9033_00295 [bacterium]|nr:hypothetical protein [bacterium]
MKINIANKTEFIRNFLSPIGKVCENAVVNIKPDSISALTSTYDSTLFLNCKLTQKNVIDNNKSLNIPDINKFISALSCTGQDNILFDVTDNCINYKSDNVKFKLHLLEEGIINTPAVNIEKLKNIKFNTQFEITHDTLQTLVKGSTFASDVNKLYFNTTSNGEVRGEITDSESQNVNTFGMVLAKEFTGDPIPSPRPLTFEVIRFILTSRFEKCIIHHSNDLNVFLFDISTKDYTINYIASGLRR